MRKNYIYGIKYRINGKIVFKSTGLNYSIIKTTRFNKQWYDDHNYKTMIYENGKLISIENPT